MLMKTSGEKIGFLFGGEELEQRILEEGETLLKEKKPRVMVLSSGRRGFSMEKDGGIVRADLF